MRIKAEEKRIGTIAKLCTDENGFTKDEITCSKDFFRVGKDGVIQYTDEFLGKFMGGIMPNELSRRGILFADDGTLTQMHVAEIPKGAIFGELGILQKKRRAATIIAKCPCDMGYIAREDYERILLEVEKIKLENKKRFFGTTVFRNAFSADLAYEVGYMFTKKKFHAGQHIFRQGDVDTKTNPFNVYVIQKGSVMVYVNEKQKQPGLSDSIQALTKNVASSKKRPIALMSTGELFGDTEIQDGFCQISTVCREACQIWVLDKDKWLKMLRDEKKKLVADFVMERIKVKQKSRALWETNAKTVEKNRQRNAEREKMLEDSSKEPALGVMNGGNTEKVGGTVREGNLWVSNGPHLRK